MIITMSKFGTVLDSRPAGREAFLAVRPRLKKEKEIVVDFSDVEVLTPSFADEFIVPLTREKSLTVRLTHTQDNITVRYTIAFLKEYFGKGVSVE